MLLASVCLTLSVFLFIRWLWSRRDLYILSWQMPGPVGFPIVGSAYRLLRQGVQTISQYRIKRIINDRN